MATYADNFDPPDWWRERARAKLGPRGSQAALLRALKAGFGVDYDKGKLSRLLSLDEEKREGAPLDMLIHMSLVLQIPIPIFVAVAPDELKAAQMLGDAMVKNEIDPEVFKIAAGVRHMLIDDQTDIGKSVDDDIKSGSGPKRK